jgi:hypothetical protein
MNLIRLIYISAAVAKPTEQELKSLLIGARERNAKREITGFLIYRNCTYLQVLEGEKEQVLNLFTKIKSDPRNHSTVKLVEEPIEKRDFSQWYMGFENLDTYEQEQLPAYVQILDGNLDETKIQAVKGRSLKLLLKFAQQETIR